MEVVLKRRESEVGQHLYLMVSMADQMDVQYGVEGVERLAGGAMDSSAFVNVP